ncbi:hypothetical protein CRENBAI_016534 [Crenichthys baileyi]|uniref:Uncharacterized protein n=1 Tax=Crenichthys baileyi TaxID=28760 RepID=A0AAV9S7H2_9TELE
MRISPTGSFGPTVLGRTSSSASSASGDPRDPQDSDQATLLVGDRSLPNLKRLLNKSQLAVRLTRCSCPAYAHPVHPPTVPLHPDHGSSRRSPEQPPTVSRLISHLPGRSSFPTDCGRLRLRSGGRAVSAPGPGWEAPSMCLLFPMTITC